ncbi:VCBS repeat-containing protein [Lentzea tibetensis]|uniref:VCBS repeat-containing protein n=1 Tax=Lentzea tibetensis TaxID=2591470 RepID=A0A563EV55_9PSEU|nr:VCBS repeat-containing protein [Lentzea tibetensis]TWP51607.1 VCBS repeat-containing protein [Lentzea tibetensis]
MQLRRAGIVLALTATAMTFAGMSAGHAAPAPGAGQGEPTAAEVQQVVVTASPISRGEVIARAQTWVDARVPYSQKVKYNGYRTDCSGFVSMAWRLSDSLSTETLVNVSHLIPKSELRAGDIMMNGGPGSGGNAGHVAIFERWVDGSQTSYWAYEQAGPDGAPTSHHKVPYPYFGNDNRFKPYRYNHIVDDTTGSSLSGDGRAEIAKVGDDGNVIAWRNDNGFAPDTYRTSNLFATEFTADNIQFADLDGDGGTEIIKVGADGNVIAWRNDNGFAPDTYRTSNLIATEFTADNIQFADLNGDRKAEIIKVGDDGNVIAWKNEGGFADRPYRASAIIATEFTADNVHFGDLNGDGKAEIAKVGDDGNVIAWKNEGGFASDTYRTSHIIATEFTADNIQFADLNGDGRTEIIKVGDDGNVIAWRNDNGFAPDTYRTSNLIATEFTADNIQFA